MKVSRLIPNLSLTHTAMCRGALCIPAFEIVMPEVEEAEAGDGEEEGEDADDTVFAPDYNYEDLDYTVKPDFVDTVRRCFDAGIVLNIYLQYVACKLA